MSQVTALTTLYPDMTSDLPGCDTNKMLLALQKATRDFCNETDAWHEELDPLQAYDYQQDYFLTVPNSYSAQFHRINWLKINKVEYDTTWFDLHEGGVLRLLNTAIFRDLDDMLLTCGTIGTTTVATWAAITDGSVTFDIDDTEYEVEDIDFTGCTTLDQVAAKIQDALNEEMENCIAFVRYAATGTKFVVWVTSGEVSYLTAGASGTDISGASYMNGLTGTGVLSALMEMEAVFRPDRAVDTLPDWFLDRWQHVIVAGAVAALAGEDRKPKTSPSTQARALAAYNDGVTRALAENGRSFKGGYNVMRF